MGDAAKEASRQASQSIDDIYSMKVKSWTADMRQDGSVEQYKTTVELSFLVHESRQ